MRFETVDEGNLIYRTIHDQLEMFSCAGNSPVKLEDFAASPKDSSRSEASNIFQHRSSQAIYVFHLTLRCCLK